ncbi:MAG: DUF3618 domain-containing protein [Caldilineaceae bacterium]
MTYQEHSEEIREEIEETRHDMSRKIDAIQNHLSPEKIKAQAREAANEFATATADSITQYISENWQQVGSTIVNTVKSNPVPAALIGLGIGWLVVENMGHENGAEREYPLAKRSTLRYGTGAAATSGTYGRRYEESGAYPSEAYRYGNNYESNSGQSMMDKVGETVSNAAGAVKEKAREWTNEAGERVRGVTNQAQYLRDEARLQGHLAAMDAQDKVNEWQGEGHRYTQHTGSNVNDYGRQAADYAASAADQTRSFARDTADQIGSYAQSAGEQTQHYAEQAGQQARHYAYAAGHQIQETIEENPLTLGAIALAAGAVIGLMLPQTQRENQWMGPASDQVWDTGRAAASDVVQRAQEAVDEIRPELENTAQKVADDLKNAGKSALHDTQEAAQHAKDVAEQKAKDAQSDVEQRVEKGRQKMG